MNEQKEYIPLTNIDEVLAILNKISVFGGLSDKQLYYLFRILRKVTYAEDEFIFRQGDKPIHFFIVESGKVKIMAEVEHEPLEIFEFTTGQCFGETAAIGIQPHSANAVAVGKTVLIVLPRQALLSIFETDKALFGMLILNIAREACRRLHKTDEILLHYVSQKQSSA